MQTYLGTYFWPTLYFNSGYYHFKKIPFWRFAIIFYLSDMTGTNVSQSDEYLKNNIRFWLTNSTFPMHYHG